MTIRSCYETLLNAKACQIRPDLRPHFPHSFWKSLFDVWFEDENIFLKA